MRRCGRCRRWKRLTVQRHRFSEATGVGLRIGPLDLRCGLLRRGVEYRRHAQILRTRAAIAVQFRLGLVMIGAAWWKPMEDSNG